MGCSGLSPARYEYPHGWRLHSLSRQLVPVLDLPYSKAVFQVLINFICFKCYLFLLSSIGHQQEVCQSHLYSSNIYKQLKDLHCQSLTLNILFCRLSSPRLLSLCSQDRCSRPCNYLCGPNLDLFQHHILFLTQRSSAEHSTPQVLTRAAKGKGPALDTCW